MHRRRFNPHRIIHNLKFWSIEIIALIVFLNRAGKALFHELGFSHPAEVKAAQTCAREPERK